MNNDDKITVFGLLKRLQWIHVDGTLYWECPICFMTDSSGHRKSCNLKAMIDKLSKELHNGKRKTS